MEHYVYGDVILLENLIMNFIILWCTARLLKYRHSWLLIVFASFLGALYALGSYFPGLRYYYTPGMKVIFSFLIIILAYFPNRIKDFAKLTGVFYFISFVFGGAAFGLFYFMNGLKDVWYGAFVIKDFPIKTLIIAVIVAYFTVRYCWDFIQYRVKREKIIKEINILVDDKKAVLTALVDTGNSLKEPITNTPVVVAEYTSIKDLLPKDVQEIFEVGSQDDFKVIANIMSHSELITRFRMIPFKSLGRENGMLIGFKPDEIQLIEENKKLNLKNIIVGIYNKKLSSNGEYSALMHPDIFSG